MIKVNQITEESYSILGLTNSSNLPTTIYLSNTQLYRLLYELEQIALKQAIKNGKGL